MISDNEFDKILADLDAAKQRKTQCAIIKAQAEIGALQREATAYYDGAYDALKAIKRRLAEEGDENA